MRLRYRCVVYLDDKELHNQLYKSYKDISDDLNLTYQQVADISSQRTNGCVFNNDKFKYAPHIMIEKISQLDIKNAL